MLTMQDALIALTKYWTDRGCMIVQPFNTEVGAGTHNPATILRVLGPEPWHVSYVEPSVRPDDARYGENPNRLQTHTQFQVVLKPDPGDPQEVYLGSLEALGIDVRAHDLRFVEDNWASPALGAWGLGWEVWLDGLEITQFTYFQQAGGMSLDPVSVEITYGIERIVMALQKVEHFKQIAYAPGVSYGEAFGQAEYEMSRYYLDDADVATYRSLFDEYEAEARRMLDLRLPVPAHYCVLKCSHVFNVLDSRGAVSTTERQRAFNRMRSLSRRVAELWAERRAELDHPLGVTPQPEPASLPASLPQAREAATLLFEIGTEELPAAEVARTIDLVRRAVAERLDASRLAHGPVRVYGTPRRIVTVVERVAPRQPDTERTVQGPRTSAAFDADGRPTKAAEGFARSRGIAVDALQRIESNGNEFVGFVKQEVGRDAVDVLSEQLGLVVAGLRADNNMRWSDPKLSFSRPMRWLLALLGDVEVPIAVSALASGRTTRVHRTDAEPVVEVARADGYAELLAARDIVIDPDVRREQIAAAAARLAAGVGGAVDLDGEAALLSEIVNLVEGPEPILGAFAERYLELPSEILTTVMRKHQRYLPVRAADGALMPYFIAVANGRCDHDVVRAGNEAVLRARYEDAAFFWRADLQVKPEDMKAGLAKLAFQERLGSMADRAGRIADVARSLAGDGGDARVALDAGERAALHRAADLAKFDLASQMVIELTSLAGTMAREYARRAGEPEAVAQALYDMELPRAAGDAPPATVPGAILSLADRFELIAGLFSVGANPTGSSDQFGLRRAALGAVSVLRAFPALRAITLGAGLDAAADVLRRQGVEVGDAALADAYEFAIRRYEQQLLDAGYDHRFVSAVLPLAGAPASADETLAELTRRASDPAFGELVTALQRVRRIVPADTAPAYEVSDLEEPAALALHETLERVAASLGNAGGELGRFADAAQPLVAPINEFFDAVLVMAEDPRVRAARLGLLARIRDLASGVLDWDALGTALAPMAAQLTGRGEPRTS